MLEEVRRHQDLAEAQPDAFIRYEQPRKIDDAREAVSKLLKVPRDTVVFEPNATTSVNTILKNIVWNADKQDEILYFNTIYGSTGKTIDYLVDTLAGGVTSREIRIRYPCEDDEIVAIFKSAVDQSRLNGKRPRVCVYDTVSSLPGVRFPFEELTKQCKEFGILSLIDGAQGIGMIDLDLGALDPDFFLTNCHKWLHVPRGCAALYVPLRNQGLIATTTPTAHGYVSRTNKRPNPLPANEKSAFVTNFEFTGTTDRSPYMCVPAAVKWRQDVLGGEDRIMQYTQQLAKEGGKRAAEILGTEVLDNKSGSMTNCSMTNVALPLELVAQTNTQGLEATKKGGQIPHEDELDARHWMERTLVDEYKTFLPVFRYNDRFWARISAQVYLGIEDFEWAGKVLLELSERVSRKEYKA